MPTVPQYQGPRVSPSPTPGVRVSVDAPAQAFGAGGAPADFSGFQKVAGDLFTQERDRANQIAVLNADTKLNAASTALLYDPNNGLLNRRGSDAFGAISDAQDQWGKIIDSVSGDLANDDQKLAFEKLSASRWDNVNQTLQSHVSGQIKQYDDESTTAAVNTAQNAAAFNYQSPGIVKGAIDDQVTALTMYAQRNGMPPEWLAEKIADAKSLTNTAVVNRMLATKSYDSAKSYYDAHKDEFSGESAPKIEEAIQGGLVDGESERQANRIFDKAKTETEAYAMVKEVGGVNDTAVRDATNRRLDIMYNKKDQQTRKAEADTYLSATNIVEATHDPTNIPRSMWNTFSIGERDQLQNYAEKLSSGKPIQTNIVLWSKLMDSASDPSTIDTFAHTDLVKFKGQLSDSDFKGLKDLQVKIRNGDQSAQLKLNGYLTTKNVVDQTFEGAVGKTTDNMDEYNSFQVAVNNGIIQFEVNNKRDPSPEEARVIANDLMVNVVLGKGWFGNTTARAYKSGGAPFTVDIKDIPAAEVTNIKAALRSLNLPITDYAVVDEFKKKIRRINGGN